MFNWLVIVWGIWVALAHSSLLRPLRENLPRTARKFIECPLCFGWWLGLGCGIGLELERGFRITSLFTVVLFAFAASGFCFFAAKLIYLGSGNETERPPISRENRPGKE